METKYKGRIIEIPNMISCNKDGGLMGFNKKEREYICFNVEGCTNRVKLKDYLKDQKKLQDQKNNELEF